MSTVYILVVMACSALGLFWFKGTRRLLGTLLIAISCYGVAAYGLIFGFDSDKDVVATIVFGITAILITVYVCIKRFSVRGRTGP